MIYAGKLRTPIAIQRRVTTQTATGAVSYAWITFATVWAEIDPKFGRETATGVPRMITTFRMRYLPGVTTAMRVVWVDGGANRIFDLTSAQDVNARHRELVLMGTELIGTTA